MSIPRVECLSNFYLRDNRLKDSVEIGEASTKIIIIIE